MDQSAIYSGLVVVYVSCDHPSAARAGLDSFERFVCAAHSQPMYVLWQASSPEGQCAYHELSSQKPYAVFLQKEPTASDLVKLLSPFRYVLFLDPRCQFVRPIDLRGSLRAFSGLSDSVALSLRTLNSQSTDASDGSEIKAVRVPEDKTLHTLLAGSAFGVLLRVQDLVTAVDQDSRPGVAGLHEWLLQKLAWQAKPGTKLAVYEPPVLSCSPALIASTARTSSGDDGPPVSIVVPLFNAVEYSRQMFRTLFEHTPQGLYELIVVDNASKDETREFLKTISDRATIILNQENKNFSGACNAGAALARGKYILFLNSDTILQPRWLEPMLAVAEQDSKVGLVGNKHIYPVTNLLHHAGVCFDDAGMNSHYLVGVDPADPRVSYTRDLEALNGACLLVRRDLFEKAGRFNQIYKNGCEDIELCLQAREFGYRIVFTPDSVIYHYGQRSPNRSVNDDANMRTFMGRWGNKIRPSKRTMEEEDAGLLAHRGLSAKAEAPLVTEAILGPYNQPLPLALYTEWQREALSRALRIKHGPRSQVLVFAPEGAPTFGPDPLRVTRAWQTEGSWRHLFAAVQEAKVLRLHVTYTPEAYAKDSFLDLLKGCHLNNLPVKVRMLERISALAHREELLSGLQYAEKVVVGYDADRRLLEDAGLGTRIELRPFGTTDIVDPLMNSSTARQLSGIPETMAVLTACGSLNENSGFFELLEVFSEVAKQKESILLALLDPYSWGSRSEEYVAKCQERAAVLGITGRVVLPQKPLELRPIGVYLHASSVVISHPQAESAEAKIGIAQALSHGRPIVATAFAEEFGSAIAMTPYTTLAATILEMLQNPQRLAQLRVAAEQFRASACFYQQSI